MTDEALLLTAALLRERRVLTVGLVVGGAPVLGLLPFVLTDEATLLVHGSRLARHSRALAAGGMAAVLVHEPDVPGVDPLQVPRLSLEVETSVLEKTGEAFSRGRSVYLARFPEGEVTFSLPDFQLFALRACSGRLVAGFGRAWDVSREELLRACGNGG
jgi:hypothetical protein